MVQNITRVLYKTLILALSSLFLFLASQQAHALCETTVDSSVQVSNYTNLSPITRDQYNELLFKRDPRTGRTSIRTPEEIQSELQKDNFQRSLKSFYRSYYSTPSTSSEARDVLSSIFANKDWLPENCANDMRTQLDKTWVENGIEKRPNLYIYVGGFGQHVQLNDTNPDSGEIIKWINKNDPNALVVSLGWLCDSTAAVGNNWCKTKAEEFKLTNLNHPVKKKIKDETRGDSKLLWQQLDEQGAGNDLAYNESLAHVLELASHLIDLSLTAKIGDVHLFGYSMGAHAVAELMTFDYKKDDNKEGYPWSEANVCEHTSDNTCTVSDLKKVKWALALGLPGWSQALRYSYQGFRYTSAQTQGFSTNKSPEEREHYENGGLFRVEDTIYKPFGFTKDLQLKYNNKLVVFNKRYDPTSVADDVYQRGISDVIFNEYNHYGHDYNRPYFWSSEWTRILKNYLEAPQSKNIPEMGVIWEGPSFSFDDCETGLCNPKGVYAIHQDINSHWGITPLSPTQKVRILNEASSIAGTPSKVLAVETESDAALKVQSMDQEDLRGAVELSWQPKFDLSTVGTHGIFSYGTCEGSAEELMPRAYVQKTENSEAELVFEIRHQEKSNSSQQLYQLKVKESELLALGVAKDKWTQLSFGWELPTQLLTTKNATEAEKEKYGDALKLSAGLWKGLRNSMRKQAGKGSLVLWVNGKKFEAPLGSINSSRECLTSIDVLKDQGFTNFNGDFEENIQGYNPYRNFNEAVGPINFGTGTLGETCKAFKIRNAPVFFGCAKNNTTNATAYMDNIRVIFGPARVSYPEVTTDGSLKSWEQVAAGQ